MHEPEHVLGEIQKRYRNNWRNWLLEPPDVQRFPLAAPSADVIARSADSVGEWKKRWSAWHGEHSRAVLVSATKKTSIGPQDVFTHVQFATASDLASVDVDRARHWWRASARWSELIALHAGSAEQLHSRVKPALAALVDLDLADFTILLRAAAWFRENPASGMTVRQVPVLGMHTKWLKKHKSLVLAILGSPEAKSVSTESDDDDLAQSELDALGLRALPVHIDVIVADPSEQSRIGGLRSVRAPLPDIAKLPLAPRVVVIVENKESALLVADHEGVAVIHSLGNHLNVLAEIPWIAEARVIYWGDLDRAGITLLSRARSVLPDAESVLMDPDTLARYIELANPDSTKADPPEPTLTAGELEALSAIDDQAGGYLRLEQERLPADYVIPVLEEAINRRIAHRTRAGVSVAAPPLTRSTRHGGR